MSATEDDRRDWDRAWAAMPHRCLASSPKIDLSEYGEVASATISLNPPQFSQKVVRVSESCPVCGVTTAGTARLCASLHPVFDNGLGGLGLGVWVHERCFEECLKSERPAPIPW